jgi:pimeloyl-ACP methyl ester carboxylesterase
VPASSIVHATSSDGTQLATWRAGSGPALILVHGTTADHTRWARVSSDLERDFTVYALDRRGRGGSRDGATYSIAPEGDDVVAGAANTTGPVSLLGHSYGALCCIEAALRMPDLHRLILYEPPVPLGIDIVSAEVRTRLDGLLERNEHEAALLVFFREVVHVPEAQLHAMRAQPAWAARVAAAQTLGREARVEANYRPDFDRLRLLSVPTLLLLGSESPPYFRGATNRLHAAMPNSQIHEMAGQHHVAMDMIPDEFVRIVSSFLRS